VLLIAVTAAVAAAQPYTAPTQNALAGSRVFGSKGCAKCHAINGLGGTEGPDLARTPRSRTFYDLGAAMWNHLPSMIQRMEELAVEQPRLNEREAGDLIAFLYSQDFFDPPGNPDRGKHLFTRKQCVQCHQVGGVGAVIGPDLTVLGRVVAPIQIATAMWNHGPNMIDAMKAKGIERPRFTAQELNDLIAYIEAEEAGVPSAPLHVLPGSAGEGSRVFAEKGCADCHAAGGVGGEVAPDLAQRGRNMSMLGFAAAMWNKAPAMTAAMRSRGIAVPQLSPAQMADLVGFLYSVKYFAQPGTSREGRRLLGAKGCVQCHALDGRGQKSASDLSAVQAMGTPAAVIAALWNHGSVVGSPPEARSSWPTLTAGDIANLTEFLASAPQRSRN
jgi:mono/diheme cytochrome c family protein